MSSTLTISILADTANATRGINSVSNELTGLSGVTAKVGANLKTLAAGFVGFQALEFVADRFRQAGQAVMEQEKLLNQTNAALKSTGNVAGVTSGEIVELSNSLERKSLIDAEAIQAGQNLLLTFTNIRNEAGAGNDIFNQTTEIMVDLATALGTNTTSAATLLGKALNDPIAGLSALSRAGVQFTDAQKEQIRVLVESGDVLGAQKIILGELETQFGGSAAASADTFAGSIKRLNDDIDAIFEAVVTAAVPALEFIADGIVDVLPLITGIGGAIGDVVGWFTELPGPVQVAVVSLAAVAALKGPVSSAFETMSLQALYLRDGIANASVGMGTLRAAGGGIVSFLGGPWGIALAAGVTGLTALVSALIGSGSAAADAAGYQEDLAAALDESNGVIDDNVRALAAQKAADTAIGDSNMLQVAEDLGIPLSLVTDALLGNADALNEVNRLVEEYYDASLLAENAGNLGMTENAENGRILSEQLDELNPVLAQTREEQRQVEAATAATTGATGEAADAQSGYQTELEASEEALKAVKDATDDFKLSLDILTGSSVSMAEAESAVQQSYADATTALEDLDGTVVSATGSFNLNTEAGRAAFDQLNDVTDASNSLISTMTAQGRSSDEVRARDAQLRESWIRTAMQMGFNEDQANALADQYYGIPSERYTQIDSNVAQVSSQVTDLTNRINSMPTSRNFSYNVKTIYSQAGTAVRGAGGTVPGFASGGYTGPGNKYQVAGYVHAGEWVLTAEQVNAIGLHNLHALYGGDFKPKGSYASGGYASMGNTYNVNVTAPIGSNPEDIGATVNKYLIAAKRSGRI